MFEENVIQQAINYGLPAVLLVIFLFRVVPALDKLTLAVNALSIKIDTLSETQLALLKPKKR